MSDDKKPDDLRQHEHHDHHEHPNVEIERIETVSTTTAPWSVRLIFGVLGVVFLAAALAAWQFRALFEGHVAQALPYIIIGLAVLGVGAIVESITTEIWLALIAGVVALAVTFLIVGRAQVYPAADGTLYMIDRFSGSVQYCTPDGCKSLQDVRDLPKRVLSSAVPADVSAVSALLPAAAPDAAPAPQAEAPVNAAPQPPATQAAVPAVTQPAVPAPPKPAPAKPVKH